MSSDRIFYHSVQVFISLCIAAGWLLAFLFGLTPVPLGLCPFLVLTGSIISAGTSAVCFVLMLLVYVLSFFLLRGVFKQKRYGTVGMIVLFTLDAAANIVLTAISWSYIFAVLLDAVILMGCFMLYRLAGRNSKAMQD